MKKTFVFTVLLSLMLAFSNAMAGGGPDYDKEILGSWQFDMGGGMMASVEYKADGTFIQKISEMTISGKYTIKGSKLTTVANKKTTVFSFHTVEGKKITLIRDTDKKTVVYIKK